MTDDDAPPDGGTAVGLMRVALMRALLRPAEDPDGGATTKLQLVADKLVDKAADGDMSAIKEVFDRSDGRSVQGASVADDGPKKVILQWKNSNSSSNTSPAGSSLHFTTGGSDSPAS
jgi:hypothetical protein